MSTTRIVSAIAAMAVLPSALVIGATSPAAAEEAPQVTTKAEVKAQTLARYGVYPLPVPLHAIKKYHFSRKQLRQIAKAKALSNTAQGRKIKRLESGTNYKYNDGHYYGAWNFDRGTWLSNGGGRFGSTANKAPAWAQDYIMWKTYRARGWSPWSTA